MRKVLYRELINFTEYSDFIHTGWFHRFLFTVDSNRALIETTSGNIITVDRDNIKFVNTPEDEMLEQRRYEIARDIFANDAYNSTTIAGAVRFSDELIKELKGESK